MSEDIFISYFIIQDIWCDCITSPEHSILKSVFLEIQNKVHANYCLIIQITIKYICAVKFLRYVGGKSAKTAKLFNLENYPIYGNNI